MRRNRPVTAIVCAATLALTAAACGPGDGEAGGDAKPTVAASLPGQDGIKIPDQLKDKLKEHGIDLEKWKGGEWKNWQREDWLREAGDYVNPIIEDLWDPDRMRDAEQPQRPSVDPDAGKDQGVTDPTPVPVAAKQATAPYNRSVPESGKVFFDGPEGSMVCSATVVKDPARPGKSNMVWTAGHCVHAGKAGGWYRNIAFVPSYNNAGKPAAQLKGAPRSQVAPFGVWWSDWAQTSDQWIATGGPTGGAGAPYDFAVLHVTPEKGSGKSLEETVGSALPVEFNAQAVPKVASITATGYPAAAPFDGQRAFQCTDRPGRLSLKANDPVMYRIGCTMTGGSSGGGWVAAGADGRPALVSNTSIGPAKAGWLAGPRLGPEAKGVFDAVSGKFK
ncbi:MULTISPECIES: trypsin-like serine peptidase [unclassified Streptomyces]|uniref:trypsin-like serine peptidase n=1 Tax=unclassified Streptomyces TaxID=2593676 RepID=UPI00381AAA80